MVYLVPFLSHVSNVELSGSTPRLIGIDSLVKIGLKAQDFLALLSEVAGGGQG